MRWLCQVHELSPCCHCTSSIATGANSTSEHPFSCWISAVLILIFAPKMLWLQLQCLNLWSFLHKRGCTGAPSVMTTVLLPSFVFEEMPEKGVACQQTPHKSLIQKQTEAFWAPCSSVASNMCASSRQHAPHPIPSPPHPAKAHLACWKPVQGRAQFSTL